MSVLLQSGLSAPSDDLGGDEDFCLDHGYDHMRHDRGPIAYCAECDRDAASLSETDLITTDLAVNEDAVAAIAGHRAHRTQRICADIGHPRDLDELIAEEAARLRQQAAITISLRRARAEVVKLPARERLVRSLETRLAVLRDGLGMPRDERAIAHYEGLLTQARAAAPDDAGVVLADMIEARQ